MRAIAVLRLVPGADLAEVRGHLDDEVQRLWRLYTEGTLAEAHLTGDPTVVVLALDAPDRPAAEQALASLPLVATGAMTAELHVLRPFRTWERLFPARPPGPAA